MIPVHEPVFLGNEKKYLCQAIDEKQVSGEGRFVKEFEKAFAGWSGNRYAVAVSSGTAALETAIWALGLREVSIPTGTIISCYVAALRAGARVTLRDNAAGTFKTGIRCHLFGHQDQATGGLVVDDLSQYWEPFKVQDVGAYSLYANKLITSGEGGVVVTNRKSVADAARSYRNLCHGKERFVHTDRGYNFRMSNLQAAVALAQLEKIDVYIQERRRVRDLYMKHLPLSIYIHFDVHVPWMMLVSTRMEAWYVVEKMKLRGVECRRFFLPIHMQPFERFEKAKYPVAEGYRAFSFYLPSSPLLTEKEIAHVCKALRAVLRQV